MSGFELPAGVADFNRDRLPDLATASRILHFPRLFSGSEIRRHEEAEAPSDWQFRRKAPLARLVAIKRAGD